MSSQSPAHNHARELTPLQAFMALIGVAVVLGALILLYSLLHIHAAWVAFIFLTYWSNVDDWAVDRLLPCVCGGLFGLFLLWTVPQFELLFGERGFLAFLVLLMAAIYCLIMKWAGWLINTFAMFILTVGLVPAVRADLDILDALLAFLVAVLYFASPVVIVHLARQSKAKAAMVSD